MKYITINGVEYPYKCTFNVLEKIQEEYGNILAFEKKLKNVVEADKKKAVMPDVKAVMFGIHAMIEEGMDIEGNKQKIPSEKELSRLSSDEFGVFELYDMVVEEFDRCFLSKNAKTTQSK